MEVGRPVGNPPSPGADTKGARGEKRKKNREKEDVSVTNHHSVSAVAPSSSASSVAMNPTTPTLKP